MATKHMIVAIVSIIMILTIFAPLTDAESGQNGCIGSGCHGSEFFQYINILPDHESSSFPETIEKNESFTMALTIENECSDSDRKYSIFDWTEITLSFDSDSITASRYIIRTGEIRRGINTYYITLECHKVVPVMVTIDAVGHNPHEDVISEDSYIFSINSVIELSSYIIDPRTTDHVIDIIPSEDIDRVEINSSAELQNLTNITPMNLSNLAEGVSTSISLQILDPSAEGAIYFIWWTGNRTGTVNLTLFAPSETSDAEDNKTFVLVGRVTGVLSFILLVFSTVLCLNVKKWRKFTIRKLRKKRIPLHCYTSYSIVALSVIHLVVLLARGKYSSSFEYCIFMTGNNSLYYNLGHISLYTMIILGLTGIYQKRMMKFFKKRGYPPYPTWRRVHLALTILALILVIVHMVIIGSDFKWLG